MIRNGFLVLTVTLFAVGCGAGAAKTVRKDIQGRMTSAEPALVKCYTEALQAEPGISGKLNMSFVVEAKTGKFRKVAAAKGGIASIGLRQCVVETVGALKLAKPQPVPLIVPSYPLEFSATP